jgi:DNA-binding NarL/FixJ family response regulator
MRYKLLWIEDAAEVQLVELVGPIYRSGLYDLRIETTAAGGQAALQREKFDVVIVDIRLPPGEERSWVELSEDPKRGPARLGLELLKRLLSGDQEDGSRRPAWLSPDHIAVFTVESDWELADDMKRLGIKVFQQKTVQVSRRVLLDLAQKVLRNRGLPEGV